jgi:RecB family endonuclease NucS
MFKVTPSSQVGQLRDTTLEGEKLLESYLRDFISDNHQLVLDEIGESGLALLPPERSAHDTTRDRIDLLGIDTDGAAVIIELKRGKHKLHMLQALSYAAAIADRSAEWFIRQLAAEQLEILGKPCLANSIESSTISNEWC